MNTNMNTRNTNNEEHKYCKRRKHVLKMKETHILRIRKTNTENQEQILHTENTITSTKRPKPKMNKAGTENEKDQYSKGHKCLEEKAWWAKK